MLLAFAGALLVPAFARAALLPACEHDPATRMAVEWLSVAATDGPADAQDACNLSSAASAVPAVRAADDLGDLRVAPMCDVRGASAIAPPRIHTIGDDRIEAVTGPGAELYSSVTIGPGPRDCPAAGAALALADHAVLDPAVLVPPPSSELAAPFLPVTGNPRAVIARGIDHPPR